VLGCWSKKLSFFSKFVIKLTIVIIFGYFSTFAKFREIPRKYPDSAEKSKFRGSAQTSAARGKLWALVLSLPTRLLQADYRPSVQK